MKSKAILMFILIIRMLLNVAFAEEILKIAHDSNYPPLSWQEEKKGMGILIDVTEEALSRRMGVKISHHFFPWKRVQKYVEEGAMDAFITNHTQTRKKYTYAGNELITNIKRSIFIKNGNVKIPEVSKAKNISQIKPFTTGNYIGNGWAEANLKDMNIIWTSSFESTLKMLSNDRFDIFIGNPLSTKYKLKVLNIQNIIMLSNSLEDIKPSQFKLLIGKNSKYVYILKEFDSTLRKMREEGVIDSIIKKYQ